MSNFSVIICTYNPNKYIFEHCLNSILQAAKTCSPSEIIIVDNNSNNNFYQENYFIDFTKLSHAKLIHEPKQGLTPARLRGIASSSSEILIFVDDDNIVQSDFFEKGIQIANKYPLIGAWSGQVKLKFEEEPPPWTRRYWGLLVHRDFSIDKWSNLPLLDETMPCGAGLFVKSVVAIAYQQLHEQGMRGIQLDRTAQSLLSGGDNDLAACACDLGMGVGLFHQIVLEHYIPKSRLERKYLLNLAEGIATSSIVFKSFRGETPPLKSWKNKIADLLRLTFMNSTERTFYLAVLKGQKKGFELLKNINGNK